MIRAYVVDDEPLSVVRLTALLGRFSDVQIVGSASNGQLALSEIGNRHPDVVFVDIEMPDMDGFDLVEEVAKLSDFVPLVVFVTAYPGFAASAFDTGAIDFVTKPVRYDRLSACLTKIRDSIENQMARARLRELIDQIEALRAERNGLGRAEPRFLWVRRRGEAIRIDLGKLDRLSGEGEYVRLFLGDREYLHRGSVTAIMAMLDPTQFLRVHRSHIVRIGQVVSVHRRRHGGHCLVLASGVTIPVGRRYRQAATLLLATPGPALR